MTLDNSRTKPSPNTSASSAGTAGARGRSLILFGAVSVALVSTAAAYVAMVGFGRDVLEMGAINAYAFAGVFELSLVTVALMAREAAQQNRPAQTLLTLTWALSTASGIFAGWHEVYMGHSLSAVGFRFMVPLLAALMWHLALVGDRHLAMERSWSELRAGARIHTMLDAGAARSRAVAADDGSRRARRRVARATARRDRAESVALRSSDPTKMRELTAQWADAFDAVRESRAVTARFATDPLTDMSDQVSAGTISATVVDVTSARSKASVSAQALTPALNEALTDERSSAHDSAHPFLDGERSPAHADAHQVDSVSAHEAAQDAASRSSCTEAQPSAHDEMSAPDERPTAQPTQESVAIDAVSSIAQGKGEVSDRALTDASDERSAATKKAPLKAAQPTSRLRAVPSAPKQIPAGPARDAIVDEMLADDSTVTGVQVAKRLGLAEQSGRRELKAARDRAAAQREAVNQ